METGTVSGLTTPKATASSPVRMGKTFLYISRAIQRGGFRSLQEGQSVQFDVVRGP